MVGQWYHFLSENNFMRMQAEILSQNLPKSGSGLRMSQLLTTSWNQQITALSNIYLNDSSISIILWSSLSFWHL